MPKGRKPSVDWSKPRSSAKARDLINKSYKRTGNYHKTAAELGLPSGAHCRKLHLGLMVDSPSMLAAIKRAERRAKRAYYNHKIESREDDARYARVLMGRATRDLNKAVSNVNRLLPFLSEETGKDTTVNEYEVILHKGKSYVYADAYQREAGFYFFYRGGKVVHKIAEVDVVSVSVNAPL